MILFDQRLKLAKAQLAVEQRTENGARPSVLDQAEGVLGWRSDPCHGVPYPLASGPLLA